MPDYYDLGTYSRKVTTTSDDAQRYGALGRRLCRGTELQ